MTPRWVPKWLRTRTALVVVVVSLASIFAVLRDGGGDLSDRLLELERPGQWTEVSRTEKGIASPYGEMSGLASSKVHSGVVWGLRDSGNPATLYALSPQREPGRFGVAEFPVEGARNRDWEDLVYGEDPAGQYLLIVDVGAKTVYRVAEPDPAAPGPVGVVATYRYAFPDRGRSSCGPSDNVEAAFLYPALNGLLHIVRKEKSPARVYRFERLSDEVNVPVQVGELDDSCISVMAVSADNAQIVTASHSDLRVRAGKAGDLASFLGASPVMRADISPDNNEGGDFYPFGSDEILIGAENRTTWRFRHRR